MPGSLIALIIAQSVGALLFGMNINMRGSMTERIGGALVIALTVGAVLSVFVGGVLWMIGFVVGTIFIAKIGLWIVSPASHNNYRRMAELTFSVRPRKPSDLILKMMPNSEKGRNWGDDGDSLIAFSKADPALSTIWDIYGLNDFIIKRWIKTLTRTGASQEINGFNSVGAALLDVKCLDFLANQQMNPKYNDLRNQSMYISGEILKFVSGEIRGFKDGQLFNERGDPASVKDPPTPIIIEDDN